MSEPPPSLERLLEAMDEVIKDAEDDDGWTTQPDASSSKFADDEPIWTALDRGYYGRDGRPISLLEWSDLHADFNYKVVVRTYTNHAFISTVWLGMDHGWLEDSRPLIFETMIFPRRRRDKHAPWADWQGRWSTEKEARQAHETIVNLIRSRGMNAIRTRKQEAEFWREWRATARSRNA